MAKKESVRAVLPQSGTRFRTTDIANAPLMLKLFEVRADDSNYHAEMGHGLSAHRDYFGVTHIVEEHRNEQDALWQRV